MTGWEGGTLKGRRGTEEFLLSYFIVTSPARRDTKRHPLNMRFNRKSGITSFCVMAVGKQDLEGMGTTSFLQHFHSPRNVNM